MEAYLSTAPHFHCRAGLWQRVTLIVRTTNINVCSYSSAEVTADSTFIYLRSVKIKTTKPLEPIGCSGEGGFFVVVELRFHLYWKIQRVPMQLFFLYPLLVTTVACTWQCFFSQRSYLKTIMYHFAIPAYSNGEKASADCQGALFRVRNWILPVHCAALRD